LPCPPKSETDTVLFLNTGASTLGIEKGRLL